jgi:hypothetical protein
VIVVRLAASIVTLTLLATAAGAQAPKLDDVVARIEGYATDYGSRLANVVAEETYRQEIPVPTAAAIGVPARRTLRSDYALTRVEGRDAWVGYRDTFEVDGRPVRDHEHRLQQLLGSGDLAQADRIAVQNSRFNLANNFLPRTVNVPTFALNLLSERYRDRFRAQRAGTDVVAGRLAWIVEFTERDRPTIVRSSNGGDQPSRIRVVAAPESGEILQTTVSWKQIEGSIVVQYGRVPRINVAVPLTMAERYTALDSSGIRGDATYTNYRRFETSGRVIEP